MSTAIVPAAGAAARFGGDKLAVDLRGTPLLDRTIASLLDGGFQEVIVIVPPAAAWLTAIRRLLDPRVSTIVNPDPARGMFSSIQLGARAVMTSPIGVLPGDMPFVRAGTIRHLLAASAGTQGSVVPRYDGRRGHPIVMPAGVRAAIVAAPAGGTLKDVITQAPHFRIDVDVDDPGVLRDVDVPGDLAS
jgi:molybdenum cofactor cytidylyltransferase